MMPSSSLANCLRDHVHTKANELCGRFQIRQRGLEERPRPGWEPLPPPDGSSETLFYRQWFLTLVIYSFSLVPGCSPEAK